jgi:hypothetical protein
MKPSTITGSLGLILIGLGIFMLVKGVSTGAVIPVLIGGALLYLAIRGGRVATLVFGHTCIVVGAYMITWGMLLLPLSHPTMTNIFGRPLFWGIFSLMGGVCAIFHGFCHCVTKQVEQFETGNTIRPLNNKKQPA